MRHYYCSIFSKAYAYKGLLLYDSLHRWDKDFHFFLICLDSQVKDLFEKMNLEYATVISLAEIEEGDPQLLQVRKDRNDKEYIWSAKASTMLYILNNFPKLNHIVWLDGDTYFYSDPNPIFSEWGSYSIMLTEERWRRANRDRIYTKGKYNTGFMGFERDANAFRCLKWFRERLLEWCFDRLENGLWSDQLYVNDWLGRFENVGVIRSLGVNVGPYIIRGCSVTQEGKDLFVNGARLVFYHSYGFRYYDGNEFDLCSYIMSFSDQVVKWIYLPYIQACNEVMARIRQVEPGFYQPVRPRRQFVRNYFNLEVNEGKESHYNLCTLASNDYLVQALALYSSLKKTGSRFRLWALCVDDAAYRALEKLNLADVTLVSLENLMNEKLVEIRKQRKIHEFCWTLKPYLVSYILKNNINLDSILYLDSDLFFFHDVGEVFRDWGDSPIFLTRLWMGRKSSQKVGRYSAGLVGFRRNRGSMKILGSWRKNCRIWCYDKFDPGRWADQKYLDRWPQTLPAIKVSQHKGINTGPWNIKKGLTVQTAEDGIYFDGYPLVCYHFSGFKVTGEDEFELCNRKNLPVAATPIYAEYVEAVSRSLALLKQAAPELVLGFPKLSRFYNRYIFQSGDDGRG